MFGSSLDGYLRAPDRRTGATPWAYDTAASVQGVNGLAGTGGSIGAGGPAIAGNLLYQTCGMEWIGVRMGGRVLLAFELGEDRRDRQPSRITSPGSGKRSSRLAAGPYCPRRLELWVFLLLEITRPGRMFLDDADHVLIETRAIGIAPAIC